LVVFVFVDLAAGEPLGEQSFWCGRLDGSRPCVPSRRA
jgi:hypothetical protein